MGLDGCFGVDGWYVDEVEVYSCEDESPYDSCGNGVLDSIESCDDGNTANGDGCSDICQIEDGWTCEDPTEPNPDGTNVVGDWSFEDGLGTADWTPFSSFYWNRRIPTMWSRKWLSSLFSCQHGQLACLGRRS